MLLCLGCLAETTYLSGIALQIANFFVERYIVGSQLSDFAMQQCHLLLLLQILSLQLFVLLPALID